MAALPSKSALTVSECSPAKILWQLSRKYSVPEERLEEANDLSTSVPNLSPALAQAIGLFEVDGMTIFLAGGGWLIARQGHISRLWRYR